ncbi:MAG: hypothetical protein NTW28_17840 [Candidatus Solibacter sp.]|nr:hypothetical protein [Candidatus Solibacter sp.]
MKNKAFQLQLVCVLATIAFGTVGCGTPNTSGRNAVIEAALMNQGFGLIGIPTGKQVRVNGDVLAFLKKAESSGLVAVREIPQGYLDSFLNTTQGMGRPFEVVATPKLLGIALETDIDQSQTIPPKPVRNLLVRISEAKMDKIVTADDYKGPLATPGEKHQLILGLFRSIPTPAAAVVGPDLVRLADRFRFRCVVKYSEFNKQWSVVALDIGSIDPEQWGTANVK